MMQADAGSLDLQAQLSKLRLLGPLQPAVAHVHLFVGLCTHLFASLSFSSAVRSGADFQLISFPWLGICQLDQGPI